MVTMPLACASFGAANATVRPSYSIVPASGVNAPDRIFSRVDLPAPFSPMKAWISPAPTSRSTDASACTPGNDFSIPVMRNNGRGALIDAIVNAAARVGRPHPSAFLLDFAEALGALQVFLGDSDRRDQQHLLRRLLARLDEVGERLD